MEKLDIKNMIFADRPSFFKIMFSGHSSENLRIPPDFIKIIPNELERDEAVLKGSWGGHWHIKVVKNEDGLYLQQGWQRFLRENSLGDNEFLIFRYDGDMCFNVTIYDKSGCERDQVAIKKRSCEELSPSHRKRKVGRPRKRKAGRPRKIPVSTLHSKKSNFHQDGSDQNKVKTAELDLPIESIEDSQLKKFEERSTERETKCRRKNHPTEEEEEEEEEDETVWKAASHFTSKFPYFKSGLKDYNAKRVFVMAIPTQFSRKHFLGQSRLEMILRNPEGREWEVNLVPTVHKAHAFCGGWNFFVRDNHLKPGDACIFELVDKNEMNVHFFRSKSETH